MTVHDEITKLVLAEYKAASEANDKHRIVSLAEKLSNLTAMILGCCVVAGELDVDDIADRHADTFKKSLMASVNVITEKKLSS